VRRAHHVVRQQLNATADGDGFLAAANIHAADDLALPVEFALDSKLELPGLLHVKKHFEERFFGEKVTLLRTLAKRVVWANSFHIHEVSSKNDDTATASRIRRIYREKAF
jgi:hypothetical protein